jgi:hypothetical protein
MMRMTRDVALQIRELVSEATDFRHLGRRIVEKEVGFGGEFPNRMGQGGGVVCRRETNTHREFSRASGHAFRDSFREAGSTWSYCSLPIAIDHPEISHRGRVSRGPGSRGFSQLL